MIKNSLRRNIPKSNTLTGKAKKAWDARWHAVVGYYIAKRQDALSKRLKKRHVSKPSRLYSKDGREVDKKTIRRMTSPSYDRKLARRALAKRFVSGGTSCAGILEGYEGGSGLKYRVRKNEVPYWKEERKTVSFVRGPECLGGGWSEPVDQSEIRGIQSRNGMTTVFFVGDSILPQLGTKVTDAKKWVDLIPPKVRRRFRAFLTRLARFCGFLLLGEMPAALVALAWRQFGERFVAPHGPFCWCNRCRSTTAVNLGPVADFDDLLLNYMNHCARRHLIKWLIPLPCRVALLVANSAWYWARAVFPELMDRVQAYLIGGLDNLGDRCINNCRPGSQHPKCPFCKIPESISWFKSMFGLAKNIAKGILERLKRLIDQASEYFFQVKVFGEDEDYDSLMKEFVRWWKGSVRFIDEAALECLDSLVRRMTAAI